MEYVTSSARDRTFRVRRDEKSQMVIIEIIEDGTPTVRAYMKPAEAAALARNILNA